MTVNTDDWIIESYPPPHDKSTWAKMLAHIRKNETGEIRIYKIDGIMDEDSGYPHTFIWHDGNYACDCNRELFFEYALEDGMSMDDIGNECSDGRFSVNLQNPKTGLFFYREYDMDENI